MAGLVTAAAIVTATSPAGAAPPEPVDPPGLDRAREPLERVRDRRPLPLELRTVPPLLPAPLPAVGPSPGDTGDPASGVRTAPAPPAVSTEPGTPPAASLDVPRPSASVPPPRPRSNAVPDVPALRRGQLAPPDGFDLRLGADRPTTTAAIALLVAAGLFLVVQDRFDRKSAWLARAATDRHDETLEFS